MKAEARAPLPAPSAKHSRRALTIAATAVVLGAVAFLADAVYEAFFVLDVTELEVAIADLPQGAEGLRLLHLSDLHFDRAGVRERRLIERVRELHPDLAVVTGDIVNGYLIGLDRDERTARIERVIALLGEVQRACHCAVYLVRGNHDDDDQLTERLPDTGMTLLINDCAVLPVRGGALAIVGIDHFALADAEGVADAETFRVADVNGSRALVTDEEYKNVYVHYVGAGARELANYRVSADVMFENPRGGTGLIAYSQMPWGIDRFYRLRRFNSHRADLERFFHLAPHDAYCEDEIAPIIAVAPPRQTPWRLQLTVTNESEGTRVRGDILSPPGAPVAQAFDRRDHLANGTFGVWTFGPGRKVFDNLRVESLADGALIYQQDFEHVPLGALPPELQAGPKVSRVDVALARVPPGAIPIALVHAPRQAVELAAHHVPLILAGDTHGGQIRLPVLDHYVIPDPGNRPFLGGLYHLGESTLYVSRGVGTSVIPLRFRSRPEVTMITLRRESLPVPAR